MSYIKYTEQAINDLQRLANFLENVAPEKVDNAINTIISKIDMLVNMPLLGVFVPNQKIDNLRKLSIPYGKNAYIVLYSYNETENLVIIQTIRHSRELEPNFLRKKQSDI